MQNVLVWVKVKVWVRVTVVHSVYNLMCIKTIEVYGMSPFRQINIRLCVHVYLHIIFSVAPISFRVQITQTEALQLAEVDLRHRATDLSSYEIWTWNNMHKHIYKKTVFSKHLIFLCQFQIIFRFPLFVISSVWYQSMCQSTLMAHPRSESRTTSVRLFLAHKQKHANIHTQG